jgi:hypothetical protein
MRIFLRGLQSCDAGVADGLPAAVMLVFGRAHTRYPNQAGQCMQQVTHSSTRQQFIRHVVTACRRYHTNGPNVSV